LLLNLGVDVEPLIGLVVIRGVGRRFCWDIFFLIKNFSYYSI
jgi:hypothetical protein